MIEYLAQVDKKPTLFVNVFAGGVMQGGGEIFFVLLCEYFTLV